MIHSISPETMKADQPGTNGLSLSEFTKFFQEIQNQPAWRAQADREME